MRKALVFDSSKCTGCLYCEMICSLRHKGTFRRDGSRIRVISNEKSIEHDAQFCTYCHLPVCKERCKSEGIVVDKHSGRVSVDVSKCTGCGLCVERCPLGGIFLDREAGVAVNCDLCGGNPACVDFCPSGALQFSSRKTMQQKIFYP